MNKELLAAQQKKIDELKEKYRKDAEKILREAFNYFLINSTNKVTLKVPDTSKEFFAALELIAREKEWDFYVLECCFTRKKVKIYKYCPFA